MENYRSARTDQVLPGLISLVVMWLTCVASAALPEPEVQLAGCALLTERDGCTLQESRKLDIWVAHKLRVPVHINSNNQQITSGQITASARVQGGTRYQLVLPEGATSLSVSVDANRWSIGLNQTLRPEVLVTARDLNRGGDLEEGIKLIEQSLPSLANVWQGTALRLAGQAQRRLGLMEQAKASLSRSIDADRTNGRAAGALRTATVLAYLLMEQGNYTDARALLESDFAIFNVDADSRYNLDYFRGLLAYNTSNARLAIDHFSLAARQAHRLGRATQQVYSEVLLAVQLQRIGRSADADRYLSRWINNLPAELQACDKAYVLNNLGWTRLLLLESGVTVDDPTSLLQEADQLSAQHCLSRHRANTLTNLALARLHAGDIESAGRFVNEARSLDNLQFRNVLWLLDVEARIEAARGRVEAALEKFDRLESLAVATVSASAHWRALIGRARTLSGTGDSDGALTAYLEAELLLTGFLPTIPIDQGREALLNARARATQEHVDLLLRARRHKEAFALARESRVRSLQSIRLADRIEHLSQKARLQWEKALGEYKNLRSELDDAVQGAWMLPSDELAELKQSNGQREEQLRAIIDHAANSLQELGTNALVQPSLNELMVLMYAVPDGWAVFAHDGVELSVYRPDCAGAPDSLATCLLNTVRPHIESAEVLRLLPTGALNDIDLHAVEIDGVPLLQQVPVYYGLDLAGGNPRPPNRGAALLVADARGDLASARKELDAVSAALDNVRGWRQQQLQDQAATAAEVRNALPGVELFHFAGHARYAGEFGWDSQLHLAHDTILGITDIITLSNAPSLVVLSGCETARTRQSSFAQSMGLASAFLLAGSHNVLATTRPVRDNVAEQLMTEFYRQWTGGSSPPVALRDAQLKLMQVEPLVDWAAYRLIAR